MISYFFSEILINFVLQGGTEAFPLKNYLEKSVDIELFMLLRCMFEDAFDYIFINVIFYQLFALCGILSFPTCNENKKKR